MMHLSPLPRPATTYRWLLAALLLLATPLARAQAPAWTGATVGTLSQPVGDSNISATATDASGNVYVAGTFGGTIALGSTVLTSAGQSDLFVAKYVPSTSTWAWAQAGGGTRNDLATGIAVSGTSVYVTGYISNNLADASTVRLGGTGPATATTQVNGASTNGLATDLLLAKYTDNGTSATLTWTQVGGGVGDDRGASVAVSGTSVYVAGNFYNNFTNAGNVVFGGGGTTAGTVAVSGPSTGAATQALLLAKFTDNGSSATYQWAQVGGGTSNALGQGVAASGSSVYVVGHFVNTTTNAASVVFGGNGTTAGTVQVNGASATSSTDLVLAKYTDNGATGTLAWTQVGGGTGTEFGNGVAVSGSSVYVVGAFTNTTTNANAVVFGGSGTTPGIAQVNGASATASRDLVLAKYTDNGPTGTLAWTQVGGGTGDDAAQSVAVSGSSVYVTGYFLNNAANTNAVVVGGGGTTPGTQPAGGFGTTASNQLLLAKFTDGGTSAAFTWGQVGSSSASGTSVTVSGASVYVSGGVGSTSISGFGAAATAQLQGTTTGRGVLARATDGGSTGSWVGLAPVFNGGVSATRAVATDASGNVYVTGNFSGQVAFGSTLLGSAGSNDLFVAKWVPATNTWAWAQSGGGTSSDVGYGIAVQGTSVYVVGTFFNNAANANGVFFGGTGPATGTTQVNGTGTTGNLDVLLLKYQDNGSSATLAWTQVGGGTANDIGYGVAVSGPNVYVAGFINNTQANAQAVLFGGSGTTAGTVPVNGASSAVSEDLLLAKYTDNGPSATLGWTQVAGGNSDERAFGVAASGTSVYLTGQLRNNLANAASVVFGGGGTTPGTVQVNGATATVGSDLVLAKYQDNGSSAAYVWSQVGGGTGIDQGNSVAVRGTSVYVTGQLTNSITNASAVVFGGSGTTVGTSQVNGASTFVTVDLLLAKYTDNGPTATLGWTQVGGGTGADFSLGVAVSGTSVYMAGQITNSTANANAVVFGGSGTTPGTAQVGGASATISADLVLARYTDNGSTATYNWAQVGGGPSADYAQSVAISGQQVYAAGTTTPPAAVFGPTTLAYPANGALAVLARLTDTTLLPTRPAASATGLTLYPNPAKGTATLIGSTPGTAVQVLDALGRLVRTATADATGTAALAGLPAGLYVVRAGTGAVRLSVE